MVRPCKRRATEYTGSDRHKSSAGHVLLCTPECDVMTPKRRVTPSKTPCLSNMRILLTFVIVFHRMTVVELKERLFLARNLGTRDAHPKNPDSQPPLRSAEMKCRSFEIHSGMSRTDILGSKCAKRSLILSQSLFFQCEFTSAKRGEGSTSIAGCLSVFCGPRGDRHRTVDWRG